jgi:hypothetical protein
VGESGAQPARKQQRELRRLERVLDRMAHGCLRLRLASSVGNATEGVWFGPTQQYFGRRWREMGSGRRCGGRAIAYARTPADNALRTSCAGVHARRAYPTCAHVSADLAQARDRVFRSRTGARCTRPGHTNFLSRTSDPGLDPGERRAGIQATRRQATGAPPTIAICDTPAGAGERLTVARRTTAVATEPKRCVRSFAASRRSGHLAGQQTPSDQAPAG